VSIVLYEMVFPWDYIPCAAYLIYLNACRIYGIVVQLTQTLHLHVRKHTEGEIMDIADFNLNFLRLSCRVLKMQSILKNKAGDLLYWLWDVIYFIRVYILCETLSSY
jgi:hypothetical protein